MGNLQNLRSLLEAAETNSGTPHMLVRVNNPAWTPGDKSQPQWFEVSDFSQFCYRDGAEENWVTFLDLAPCPSLNWKPPDG